MCKVREMWSSGLTTGMDVSEQSCRNDGLVLSEHSDSRVTCYDVPGSWRYLGL